MQKPEHPSTQEILKIRPDWGSTDADRLQDRLRDMARSNAPLQGRSLSTWLREHFEMRANLPSRSTVAVECNELSVDELISLTPPCISAATIRTKNLLAGPDLAR